MTKRNSIQYLSNDDNNGWKDREIEMRTFGEFAFASDDDTEIVLSSSTYVIVNASQLEFGKPVGHKYNIPANEAFSRTYAATNAEPIVAMLIPR